MIKYAHLKRNRWASQPMYFALFFIPSYKMLLTSLKGSLVNQLSGTGNSSSDGDSGRSRENVGTSGHGLLASVALPDSGSLSLDAIILF